MIVTLQTERVQTLADVRAVIDGNDRLDYQFTDREAAYEFIRRTLVRFDYPTLSKPDKGIIGRYLAKMTGLSRAQMTRLVGQHRATGRVTDRRGGAPVRPFERRYTGADIRLLAEADAALGDMSGPATRAVMRREFEVFGQRRFERLARLSNGHLYNLRRSRTYQRKRTTFTKTRPTPVAIGERRKPRPDGQPGFLRVDTVHQGDLDGVKGVYHINTVDEVTQYEHIGCVQAISERFLLPVLEANLPGVSLSNPGIPHRQWLRVHQPTGRGAAQQAPYRRVHQVPRPQVQRQRPRRGQKRRRRAQTPRIRPHPPTLLRPSQRLHP